MPKESSGQKKTIERVMHEYKHGDLESGSGKKVKSRKQAVAISLKEAGASNQESKSENKKSLKKTKSKESPKIAKPAKSKATTKKSTVSKPKKKLVNNSVRQLPVWEAPSSEAEARTAQQTLRDHIDIADRFAPIRTIAGVDVGYDIVNGLAHAAIVIVRAEDLSPIEQTKAFTPVVFPYIPGLLSFREIPAILAALAQLSNWPDLFMVDGQGIAHPRRMGIAAHLGVLLDMPSIGVAKSRLTGKFEMPAASKGSMSPLMHGNEQIGTVLRSRDDVAPLFISPGHKVSLQSSIDIALKCITRYRLPEPTRLADKLSKCKPAPASLFTDI